MTSVGLARQRELNGGLQHAATYQSQRFYSCKNMYHKDMSAHYGCVNALTFSHHTEELLATGGDDKRVLVWNVKDALHKRGYKPRQMSARHMSNVFCLSFDNHNKKLFSAGNDEQIHVHDLTENRLTDVFLKNTPIYSLSAHPFQSELLAVATESGYVDLIDMRQPSDRNSTQLATSQVAYHGVYYHPREPLILCTSNAREGVCLYDSRKPKEVFRRFSVSPNRKQSAMSACFNQHGTEILVLRRKAAPRLFSVQKEEAICDFEAEDYNNYCTMKNGSFAGPNDEYIVSGSDDFQVYIWKKPDLYGVEECPTVEEAHLVLRSHRSIVNQAKYNKTFSCLATSGVEKCVKLWSPDPCTDCTGDILGEKQEELRRHFSRNAYVDLVLQNEAATDMQDSDTTDEDPRMLAFFDSLLEHDLALSPSESETDEESDGSDDEIEVPGINHRNGEMMIDFIQRRLRDNHPRSRVNYMRFPMRPPPSRHAMRLRSDEHPMLNLHLHPELNMHMEVAPAPMVSLERIDPMQHRIPPRNPPNRGGRNAPHMGIRSRPRPYQVGPQPRPQPRTLQTGRRSRPYIRHRGMMTRSMSRRMSIDEEARRRWAEQNVLPLPPPAPAPVPAAPAPVPGRRRRTQQTARMSTGGGYNQRNRRR